MYLEMVSAYFLVFQDTIFINYSSCSTCHVLVAPVSEILFFFMCFNMLFVLTYYVCYFTSYYVQKLEMGSSDMFHLGPIKIKFCVKCVSNQSF